MTVTNFLKAVVRLFFSRRLSGRNEKIATTNGEETFERPKITPSRNFDEDYYRAINMLRTRIDQKFPDNYNARRISGESSPYDHSGDRALAFDAASAAIAMALRSGASVKDAAAAGAASVGI